ncbi:hypothetical protein HELRODRAFT_122641, partial [Helobdella robusta]|uniref:G-protein coupled receptors family 1 profile domain-containing protein n=1 Tax=Helobdella robusta TaxID=6412 RepID=T1EGV4_HELRO
PMNACFIPLLILTTFIVNILVCLVLLKPQMRSTTNTILTTMAIADTLTGLSPIPCYLHFYTAGHYKDWVPYDWCYLYFCLIDFLPSIFHTTSIWLTVALAVQRYISVCHTSVARGLCNSRNACIAACCLFGVATLSHIGRFFEMDYTPYEIESRIGNVKYDGKREGHLAEYTYFTIYYFYRILFIHFIPCLTLIIINGLLLRTMRDGQSRRTKLLKMNRLSESRRLAEMNRTTLMLMVVVALFLIVEFPSCMLFVILVIKNSLNFQQLISESSAEIATTVVNLCILLSYPMNFFIYCAMSNQFREEFVQLFVRR